jgi:hypothetical protein
MNTLLASILLVTAGLTIWMELRRFRFLTPLSLLTIGHVLYIALNPIVFLISPREATYFEHLVSLGARLTEVGIRNLLAAAVLFQGSCLVVAFVLFQRRGAAPELLRREPISPTLEAALLRLGWLNVAFGVVGIVLIGVQYNDSAIGLYQIPYGRRTEFLYFQSVLGFLLDMFQYGAVILVTVGLLTHRRYLPIVAFAVIIVHGAMMKSKYPVLYVSCAFATAAVLSGRLKAARGFLPLAVAAVVVASLSFARTSKDQDLGGMIAFVDDNRTEWWQHLGQPWNNDFPGASTTSYVVINTARPSSSVGPLRDAAMIFVPRFIHDRGPSQADLFAAELYGESYFAGAGLSWSLVCDGYNLLNFPGVALVGLLSAMLAASINPRRKTRGWDERANVLVSLAAPVFLVAPRMGFAAAVKLLTMVLLVSYVPLPFLGYRRLGRGSTGASSAPWAADLGPKQPAEGG